MLLAELCCWYSFLQAQLGWCKTKMQGGGIRRVQLGKYKMKSCSHKTPSLSTHRRTPKSQVKAQVQQEYYCYNIRYMMVQKLDWKQSSDPQIASLSFIFAHDRCPGAAPRAQGYLHISFHPPIWILQIYRKNKQLGSFGRSSLPGAEKSSGSALWGSSLWPCLSWILPGIPTCSRSCRGKRLVCPWHSGSSPFPLLAPFPLGTALPMPVVSRVHSLVYIFVPCSLWNL